VNLSLNYKILRSPSEIILYELNYSIPILHVWENKHNLSLLHTMSQESRVVFIRVLIVHSCIFLCQFWWYFTKVPMCWYRPPLLLILGDTNIFSTTSIMDYSLLIHLLWKDSSKKFKWLVTFVYKSLHA